VTGATTGSVTGARTLVTGSTTVVAGAIVVSTRLAIRWIVSVSFGADVLVSLLVSEDLEDSDVLSLAGLLVSED
jgi:hypothetical protein